MITLNKTNVEHKRTLMSIQLVFDPWKTESPNQCGQCFDGECKKFW